MNCPNCKSEKIKNLYTYGKNKLEDFDVRCTSLQYQKPNLLKCKECKLIFSEFLNSKFVDFYTDVVDELYIEQIPFKKKYFEIVVKKIENYLNKSKNVLEIGSYYGVLGSLIKPLVNNYEGIELSPHACEFAKKNYNLEIKNESISSYLEKKDKLDIIIMSHVIEHLDDPFDVIKKIKEKMSYDSVLIFSTYNMDSLTAKVLGKHYHWIIPMHKFFFSKKVFENFFEKNNLSLVDIKKDTHIVSLKYFFIKIKAIIPIIGFLLNPLIKLKFINKINIKINLGDLDIYFVKKIKTIKQNNRIS